MRKECAVILDVIFSKDYNIDNTGKKLVTDELQELINLASKKQCRLVINEGVYLVSNLYLKSNMELNISCGTTILGTTDETKYDIIPTRVAGIEMPWYSAIINCINQSNVIISGNGIICGQGEYFYEKYWGSDKLGGMRKYYDSKGLRWACDYDCLRVRNVLISNSNDILLKEFTSKDSGFWNLHILYSHFVEVDGVKIDSSSLNGPSTDGIDIDSCHDVKIRNCQTNCNDDSICIKSGRDYDGIRVNKPSYNIEITNCRIENGYGITIGSEVSGGISNIKIDNISFYGTDCGFRIKSALPRKGYIKNIDISNLNCINVKYLFHIFLNWNPTYSICKIPKSYCGIIPQHWKVLCMDTSEYPNTIVSDITINNVKSSYLEGYDGISRIFNIEGYDDQAIDGIIFDNINAKAIEFGIINNVKNIKFINCKFECYGSYNSLNDDFDNR
ncbi:MAG: glycoside hydrolase family 28 protein [Anaeroplasma sp.]